MQKKQKNQKVVWILYITVVIFLAFLASLRLAVLLLHKSWRDNITSSNTNPFPDACGDWAAKDGCTRLVLETDGCVKTGDLPELYDIMLNVNVKTRSNKVKKCIEKIPGASD